MKKGFSCLGFFILSLATASQSADASEASVLGVPSSWRLANYIPNAIAIWYTGAPGCTTGGLSFTNSATADDKNRFWSLIMAAKAANRSVIIYYESTTCTINSFAWLEKTPDQN